MPGRGTAVAFALLLCGVVLAAAGCGLGAGSSVGKAELTVTREFGAVKVSESSAEANESDTVMRFLEGQDEIETRYGGGFVKSIDGVEESERGGHPYDWFFFVNGVLSPVGAAEVSVEGGDKIWWDIHNWAASEGVPAVVGSWPAPFTTGWEGHKPVVHVECHGGGPACATVEAALRKEGVPMRAEGEGSIVGSAPTSTPTTTPPSLEILVGPWESLRSLMVGEMIEKGPGESGIYAEFEYHEGTRSLVGLEELGERAHTFGPDAGLVAATRHFEGPPVWVVTGMTKAGVRAAAAALNVKDLRDHYAVASEAGTVTPLPLSSGSG